MADGKPLRSKRQGGRRFMLGVEVLLGLSLGAATAATLVAVLIVFLQESRLEDERRERGTLVAEAVASAATGCSSSEAVRELLRKYEISGIASDAVYSDSASIAGFIPPVGDRDDWFVRQVGGGMAVAVLIPPEDSGVRNLLIILLSSLTAVLLVLTLLAPAHVSRNLTNPLKSLLADAGRTGAIDASSAVSARASFSRLVEMLSARDEELEKLRSMAEMRADRAEASSAAIIAAISSAVCAIDSSGRLISFNPAAAELLKLMPEDMGKPFPGDRTDQGSVIASVLADGSGPEVEMFEHPVTDGGQERVFTVAISRYRDGMRAILATDVTRLRSLERRLAEEAVLAGLGTVSAGIAHEMGNTLCALSGFIDLLAKGQHGERTEALISEAGAEVQSALGMIESFKMLASVSNRSGVPLDAAKIVDRTPGWAARIKPPVKITIGDLKGRITMEPELLDRAVANLLRNARDADPDGEIELDAGNTGEYFIIRVMDRGHGLPPDASEVLRPFFSTRKDQGHMGMGLTLARRIAMTFGGDLAASPRPGGGASFELRIPLLLEGADQ